jgi:hypothetical protein
MVLIYLRDWVKPNSILRMEALWKLKVEIASSGFEPHDLTSCSMVPQQTTLLRGLREVRNFIRT